MNMATCTSKYISSLKISQPRRRKNINFESGKKDSPKKVENPLSSVYRAISLIRMLLIYNFVPHMKFITLTVRNEHNSLDPDWWQKEVYKFIRRLDYWFDKQPRYKNRPKTRYMWVLERHKNKESYHAHMIIDCPYIPHKKDNNVLQKIWGLGITNISSMTSPKGFAKDMKAMDGKSKELHCMNSYAKVVHYVSKYLVKNFKKRFEEEKDSHSEKKSNLQLYYISDGWEKPVKEVFDITEAEFGRVKTKVFTKGVMIGFVKKYGMAYKVSKFKTKDRMNNDITLHSFHFIVPRKMADEFYADLMSEGPPKTFIEVPYYKE